MIALPTGPRRLLVVAQASSASPAPLVKGPPKGYDHRTLHLKSTNNLISKEHPELLPLVQSGTLVVLERPALYSERRTDGYQEPLQIFLVGTAHVSPQSAADVRRVVQAVQAEAVVVELCRSRQAVMYPAAAAATGAAPGQQLEVAAALPLGGSSGASRAAVVLQSAANGSFSEEEQEQAGSSSSSGSPGGRSTGPNMLGMSGGGGLLPTFQRSMELGGASALLLRLLLSRLSAKMAGSLGVAGGGEFVAAREEAEALGAQLVLGDRPIEITLQRAWDALTWRQRWRLGSELADGMTSVQQGSFDLAAMERLKDDDAVSLLFNSLSDQYPQLVAPLVHERDLYLAWSLKRSKAVNGATRVVGVVGKGHLRGVCYALTNDAAGANLRFSDLVGGKNNRGNRARQRTAAVGRFALETALASAAWWAWTVWQQ